MLAGSVQTSDDLPSKRPGFDDWKYWSGQSAMFVPMPPWAQFLLELGFSVANLPDRQQPSMTAITVPSRGYAAALIGTGYQVGYTALDSRFTLEAHISRLRELPVGSTVRYLPSRSSSRYTRAKFMGFSLTSDGKEMISVLRTRNEVNRLPLGQADRVQIAASDLKSIPVRSRYKDFGSLSPFGIAALSTTDTALSAVQSRQDLVIVGQRSKLETEVQQEEFSISNGEQNIAGRLQDVLLVREFLEPWDVQGFRSSVRPASANPDDDLSRVPLAIFDGDRALRSAWVGRLPESAWIVVLDRTSRGFADACDIVDARFIERRGDMDQSLLPLPPPGIELISFLRRVST